MPEYTFACGTCGATRTLTQGMDEDHAPPPCSCGARMARRYESRFHCDEIRSVKYHDPVVNREIKGHGRYFDLGLGKYIESKSQRRRIIRQKGFQEYGIREV